MRHLRTGISFLIIVITLTAAYLKRGYVGETGSGTPISILSPYDQKMVSDTIDKYKRRF